MLPGLMQTTPLLISSILRYAASAHGAREIVSRDIDAPIWRYDYAGLAARASPTGRRPHVLLPRKLPVAIFVQPRQHRESVGNFFGVEDAISVGVELPYD